MAQKKITDLQLIGALTDSIAFPVDNGIQTYRSTGAQLKSFLSLVLPGTLQIYAGSTAPTGYLVCDGSAISRTTYEDLFDICGTTYGVGDGSTTFNIPDLRGVFVRGVGSQSVSGISYSGTLGAKQSDQTQGHAHVLTDPGHTHTGKGHIGVGGGPTYDVMETSGVNGANNGINSSSTGISIGLPSSDGSNGTPRTGTQTHPANISLNYIIKT